jgi:hypothetical protein
MMKVKVYQADINWNNKFRDYAFVMAHGGIDEDQYHCCYDGELNTNTLEDVYCELNMHHPVGFNGHSLSVSDIIKVEGLGTYFVDFIGFEEIFNFKEDN